MANPRCIVIVIWVVLAGCGFPFARKTCLRLDPDEAPCFATCVVSCSLPSHPALIPEDPQERTPCSTNPPLKALFDSHIPYDAYLVMALLKALSKLVLRAGYLPAVVVEVVFFLIAAKTPSNMPSPLTRVSWMREA